MARRSKKATRSVAVDFSGVETRVLLPESEYRFKVTGVEKEDESLVFDLEVQDGKFEGKSTKQYFNLGASSLWVLAKAMEAMGIEVPDSEVELEYDEFIDKEFMGLVHHHEYDDKTYARIREFWPVDEDEPEDKKSKDKKGSAKEDKADTKKGKKSKKEPEKVSREDFDAIEDRDELVDLIETYDLDVDADDKKLKKDEKLKAAILDALEEGELIEEEEEEEEVEEKKTRGKKGGSKKGGKKAKLSSDDLSELDEDGLGEVIEKYELDLDLDDYSTLKKKRNAVFDALEVAGFAAD